MSKSLKVVHVSDLNGIRFNIPGYQRGYRWEKKHVKALLKDILEFDSSNDPFYCLQPLVVIKNKELSDGGGGTVYDVIDGQQRLTTLFLILHCINNSRLNYSLRYERLGKGESLRYDDERVLDFEKICNPSKEQISKTADYFYLYQAIGDIKQWLDDKKKEYNDPAAIVGDLIAPSRHKKNQFLTADIEDPNKDLKDVRFIWYDAGNDEEQVSNDSETPIATFRRLNHGKTSLTAAELIKALLFQCDIYPPNLKALMKEVAFRRSTEWNEMEIRLQNPFLWNMICPAEYDKPSHIDLILSFVAKDLLAELPADTINTLETDSDYDYQVFDAYLNLGIEDSKQLGELYKERVDIVWNKIHDCFTVFNNWYEDRTVYHYIGLLVALTNSKGNVLLKDLKTWREWFETNTRASFIRSLKTEIAKIIRLKDNERLEDLNYQDNSPEIIRILLAFNVQKTLEREAEGQRFSFEFYKKMTPSLEHIHPQHLSQDDISFDILCDWYRDKKAAIMNSGKKEIIGKLSGPMSILDQYLTKESGEKKYKANLEVCKKAIAEVDKLFDTLAEIDEATLHNICNMALVDKETNSALGKKLMDAKRAKLQERSRLFDSSNHEKGAYIMTGTWMAFNKEFSDDVHSMKFWEPNDRENYLEAIKTVYNDFITLLNKQ